MPVMNREELLRWVEGYRASEALILMEQRKKPLSASEAFAAALGLLAFDESVNGDPFHRHDPIDEREDTKARAAWQRLRERWPRGR